MNDKVKKYVESKINQIDSEESATDIIKSFSNAKLQINFLKAAEDILCVASARKSGRGISYADFSTIAHQIMMSQQEKVAQWGDKAFKMSERQVAVVANALYQMSKCQ
jgi:hypothetical protein